MVPVSCGDIALSSKQSCLIALAEHRQLKTLKAEQFAQEREANPALRCQMQAEAQPGFVF